MAKDLLVNIRSWLDGSGANASGWPASINIRIEENAVEVEKYLCNVSDIFLSCDKQNNAFFIYYQNHKIYQWTAGDTINSGAAPANASAYYDGILATISGS